MFLSILPSFYVALFTKVFKLRRIRLSFFPFLDINDDSIFHYFLFITSWLLLTIMSVCKKTNLIQFVNLFSNVIKKISPNTQPPAPPTPTPHVHLSHSLDPFCLRSGKCSEAAYVLLNLPVNTLPATSSFLSFYYSLLWLITFLIKKFPPLGKGTFGPLSLSSLFASTFNLICIKGKFGFVKNQMV